jgi:hypothetical protein
MEVSMMTMTGFSPFNAIAALGICASLAMLGVEIQTEKPNETHYDFSIVAPHDDPDTDEDDSILVPEPGDQAPAERGWHRGPPRDQDGDGQPIPRPGDNDPIPT